MSGKKPIMNEETSHKLREIWKWVYRLRSVVLAIPVAIAAAVLAIHNTAKLPDLVGFNLQASGEYAQLVGKGIAVFGPVAVTAVCLLMVFCSRKVLYPWLISVFSLVLPIVIYLTNVFQ